MIARELAVKLILGLTGADKAQISLDAVEQAGIDAGKAVKDGAEQGAKGLNETARAAQKTGKELEAAAKKGEDSWGKFGSVLKKGLAILGGFALFKSAHSEYVQNADAIGKLSHALGENMEDMQAWGEGAARAGGSADGFYKSVEALNEKVQEWVNFDSGEGKKILEGLGITPTVDGRLKTTTELMADLAGAMEGMDNQTSAGLAKKLGIDPGTIMLLQSGRREVETLIKRQKELGVYRKEDAEISAKYNDAQADMAQASSGVAAIFMRVVTPAMTWLYEKITGLLVWIQQNEGFVKAFFGGIAAIIGITLIPALKAMAVAGLAAIAPFLPIIAVVGLLAAVVDDFITYIEGGESELEWLWSSFGTGEEITEKLIKAWEVLKDVGGRAFGFLKTAIKGVFSILGDVFGIAGNLFDLIKGIFTLDGDLIKKALSGILDGFLSIAETIGGIVKSFLEAIGLWDAVQGTGEAMAKAGESAMATDPMGGAWGDSDSLMEFLGRTPSAGAGAVNNSTTTQTVSIGEIKVETQATDANGIARDMGGAIRSKVKQNEGAFAG